jgi:hypothetical protein
VAFLSRVLIAVEPAKRPGQAKPYQIRQFLRDVEEFHLTMND